MTIVLTLGTFDTFHHGHMRRLMGASNLGRLVVGVCDDETVLSHKGRTPVHGEQTRMCFVGVLQFVDRVYLYNESDPVSGVSKVDVFVYSQDITASTLAAVRAKFPHARLECKSRTPGISSTAIRGLGCRMVIAADYHDTLSKSPAFFRGLVGLGAELHIITGTPQSQADVIAEELDALGFPEGSYASVVYGFEYDRHAMDSDHFERMAAHKLAALRRIQPDAYFDDNPYYANAARTEFHTFLPCLTDRYMDSYTSDHPFLTCNLQKGMLEQAASVRSDFEELAQKFWLTRAVDGSPNGSHVTAFGSEEVVAERWAREEASVREAVAASGGRGSVNEPGCGNGHFTAVLAGLFDSVHATDIAPEFVRLCAERTSELDNVTTGVEAFGPTSHDNLFCGGIMVYQDDPSVDRMLGAGYKTIVMAESFSDMPLRIENYSEGIGSMYYAMYRPMQWWIDRLEENGYTITYSRTWSANQPNRSHRMVLAATLEQ